MVDKRKWLMWLVETLLLVGAVVAFAALAAAESDEQRPTAMTPTESRMATAINAYRERHSLPPLAIDATLQVVARDRAAHCSITTPHQVRGLWPWDDCRRHGYRGFATENMAFGDISPEDAVDGWARSTVGHWRQMLGQFNENDRWVDKHFTKLGVAASGTRWVALFGN